MKEVFRKLLSLNAGLSGFFLAYVPTQKSSNVLILLLFPTSHIFILRLVVAICLLLSISGCAPRYANVIQSYDEASICCESMEEFHYESMGFGESKIIKLDENAQVYNFKTGKSFFWAYELPDISEPYYLLVESYFLESGRDTDLNTNEHDALGISGFVGYKGYYVFFPMILTLDKNFNIVRTSDPQKYESHIPSTAFKLPPREFRKLMNAPYKIKIQLPFTKENNEEKYIIILTTEELLKEKTRCQLPPIYYGIERYKLAQNAPLGAVTLSLVNQTDIFEDYRKKWSTSAITVQLNNHYEGDGFSVLPPQNPDYKLKDESILEGEQQRLSFGKFQEGGFATAYVETKKFPNYGDSEETSAKVVTAIERKLNNDLDDLKYEQSTINVDGVECNRIDSFGKFRAMMSLPGKGYDIICVHPESKLKNPTLVLHIVAAYIYPLGAPTTSFPSELEDFYKGVRFIRAEK